MAPDAPSPLTPPPRPPPPPRRDAGGAARARDRRSLAELGFPAFAGAPVRSRDGHVVATLCALDRAKRPWQEEDLVLLEQLAGAIASHRQPPARARSLGTGHGTLSWEGVELVGRHKSGRHLPIEVSFAEGHAGGE